MPRRSAGRGVDGRASEGRQGERSRWPWKPEEGLETRVTLLLWNPRGEEAGGKLGGMEGGKAPGDLSRETCLTQGRRRGADACSSRSHRSPPGEVGAGTVRREARPPRAARRDRRRLLEGQIHVIALTCDKKYGRATPVRPLQLPTTRVQSGALERGERLHIPGCRGSWGG